MSLYEGAQNKLSNRNHNRGILHADFDAFYAAVEQRDFPELRNKPVVVGGSPSRRGVVASASYESRKFGIKSAMAMSTAVRKCPEAVVVSPRFVVYREVSRQVMEVFRDITPLVEPLSLDEAYLDVTHLIADDITPPQIARNLKQKVRSKLGLTISVGVGSSKSVAKIASSINKPDGLTIVRPGGEIPFLYPLPVEVLWGIGPKTSAKLHLLSINTVEDLASQPLEILSGIFGSNATHIKEISNGIDITPVITQRERKSISSETTLLVDTSDVEDLNEIVMRLSGDVAESLLKKNMRGRTVKLKLKRSDFTVVTRQKTIPEKVQISSEIAESALELLNLELENSHEKYRLIGVGVSGFATSENLQDEMQLRFAGL